MSAVDSRTRRAPSTARWSSIWWQGIEPAADDQPDRRDSRPSAEPAENAGDDANNHRLRVRKTSVRPERMNMVIAVMMASLN
ncbi:MAG TPA: hypothetical protein VHZ24_20435 [Pirellulales bacterium]|nr:hypothetical protein [Pirellulales bacterium]